MKRKVFNKSVAFILTASLLYSAVNPINIFASTVIPNVTLSEKLTDTEKEVTVDGIVYTITSSPSVTTPGTVVVSSNKNCTKKNVVIPDTISVYNKSYYVTEISDGAFSSNHNINTLKLGKNVEKVSGYAFVDCINLEKIEVQGGNKNLIVVDNILFNFSKDKLIYCPEAYKLNYYQIPQTVTEIGDCAFYGNKDLSEVTLSSALLTVGNYAFNNCISLTKVNTSNSVTSIGNYAFAQTAVKNVLLSRALTELGEGAFLGTDITGITIPNGVKEIKANTFYNCFDLKAVKLYNNVEEIGDYAFAGTGLLSFTMPDSLKSIGYASFADCTNLVKISSNGKLKTIKDNAFSNCDALLDFVVPTATIEIGENVFTGCNHLTNFKVSLNNTAFEDKEGVLYTKGLTKLLRYPVGKTDSVYSIPLDTKEIAANALADCRYISSYEVENMNKYFAVEDDILYDFDKTILYAYPSGKISSNYTIPDYVTEIMPRAFANSILQGTVNIPSYVNEIGDGAFDGCTGIDEFNILGNNEKFTVIDGVLFSKDETTLVCYPNAKGITKYILPETVKTISPAAFKDTKLEEIQLNEGLLVIGDNAFYGSAQKEIILPKSLAEIGESAFENSALKKIVLPASVSTLGSFAFANCSDLRSVEFTSPDVIKTPGYNIFLNTKLETITVPAISKNAYLQLFTITDADSYENIIK